MQYIYGYFYKGLKTINVSRRHVGGISSTYVYLSMSIFNTSLSPAHHMHLMILNLLFCFFKLLNMLNALKAR